MFRVYFPNMFGGFERCIGAVGVLCVIARDFVRGLKTWKCKMEESSVRKMSEFFRVDRARVGLHISGFYGLLSIVSKWFRKWE